MTARQEKIHQARGIRRRNTERWLFRNAVKCILVALVEIGASGLVLLMTKDHYMINAWQLSFIYACGVIAAYLLWK